MAEQDTLRVTYTDGDRKVSGLVITPSQKILASADTTTRSGREKEGFGGDILAQFSANFKAASDAVSCMAKSNGITMTVEAYGEGAHARAKQEAEKRVSKGTGIYFAGKDSVTCSNPKTGTPLNTI